MSQIDNIEVIIRNYIMDCRGEFLKVMTGYETNLSQTFGEFYIVKGYPGESRANHYHQIATEWFSLISGIATLRLLDVETGLKRQIELDGTKPVTIKVPPLVAHSFVNAGSQDFVLVAYSDKKYDPKDTIPMVGLDQLN